MTAYIVMTKLKTHDAASLEAYAAASHQAFVPSMRPLIAYGPHEVLEGDPHEGMVVLEFPDIEAARSWYHSPKYTEARAHRQKGADYHVTLVEGFTMPA